MKTLQARPPQGRPLAASQSQQQPKNNQRFRQEQPDQNAITINTKPSA